MATMTCEELLRRYVSGERNFRGADLRGVKLQGAVLEGADFTGADLSEADVRGASFRGATLAGALLRQIVAGRRPYVAQAVNAVELLLGGLAAFFLFFSLTSSVYRLHQIGSGPTSVVLAVYVVPLAIAARRGLATAISLTIALVTVWMIVGAGLILLFNIVLVPMWAVEKVAATSALAIVSTTVVLSAVVVLGKRAAVFMALVAAFWTGKVLLAGPSLPAAGLTVFIVVCSTLLAVAYRARTLNEDDKDEFLRRAALACTSIAGTSFRGADLRDADLTGAALGHSDLRDTNMIHTCLRDVHGLDRAQIQAGPLFPVAIQFLATTGQANAAGYERMNLQGLGLRDARLSRARLARSQLSAADLRGANLRDADLRLASLKDALMSRACLDGARLDGADLSGANLQLASLEGTCWENARVDVYTFLHSGWTADDLAGLRDRGAEVLGLDGFPEEVQARLLGEKEGLNLFFSTRLSTFDKVLVDGVIIGVLGRDTKCHSEYRVQGEAAIVRLFDAPRRDLVKVAEALHAKVWEQTQAQQMALVRMFGMWQPEDLREGLSDLIGRRLDRMEMHETPMTGQSGPAHLRWTWQNPARPGSDRVLGPQPRRIFLLHAPTDRALAQELIGHMQPLIKQRLLDAFEPAKLLPGDNTSDVLDAHLDTADAVLVLVSASLFQHGPWQEQLTRAIARQKDGARVIPVLVRAVIMDGTSLAELQPLPEEGLPVTKWDDRDEAWTAVVSGLRRVLLSMA